MNDRDWRRVWETFEAAMDLPEGQRRPFLQSAAADPAIVDEVLAMLDEAADPPQATAPARIGKSIGRYEIAGILGSGGMGEVYVARDTDLDRQVAVKFLSPEAAASTAAVDRLVREAQAASGLNHPHIVTIFEVVRAAGDVAIAMELVEGASLRELGGKPQDVSTVVQWGRQAAQALSAAHQRNIVHSDIKPENLMVREDGILKILDFGLAHRAGPEEKGPSLPAGTWNYMSPEQTRSQPTTTASDIFSLGIVLYELAAGVHPFRGDSPIDTAHAIAHAPVLPPSARNSAIPAPMNSLLMEMLEKDPAKRPSAPEVERRLAELRATPAPKPASRTRAITASIAVVTLAGIALFLVRARIFQSKGPVWTQLTAQVSENHVTAAAISPDGRTLAFAAFQGSVSLRRMSDGWSRPLNTPIGLRVSRIAWFGDGSKLLVSGSAGADATEGIGHSAVWLLRLDGTAPEEVFAGGKDGVATADGSRAAVVSEDESSIWVMAPDGTARHPIRNGGGSTFFSALTWSPDGRRLSYQRRDYRPSAEHPDIDNSFRYSYESVDVDSGRQTAAAPGLVMLSACSLRDGRILFLNWTSPATKSSSLVWALPTDPHTGRLLGPARPLTLDQSTSFSSVSASSDGKQVVVVRSLSNLPNIYLADLPPPGETPKLLNVRRLTYTDAQEYPHAWTADSRTVIFESNRNGHYDLYRQEIDGHESEPLVVSPDLKVMAHVSPDGKWLLYRQSIDGVTWKVMRVPLAGGASETVVPHTDNRAEFRCALRAGGGCVLRNVENGSFVFYELDPVKGQGIEVGRTEWTPYVLGDWDLSPDGSQVAIPNHETSSAKLRILTLAPRISDRAEKTVALQGLANLTGVVWTADGRGWYASVRTASSGMMVYTDLNGPTVNLWDSRDTYAVPSPDGRRLAFPAWNVSSNAWLLRGL